MKKKIISFFSIINCFIIHLYGQPTINSEIYNTLDSNWNTINTITVPAPNIDFDSIKNYKTYRYGVKIPIEINFFNVATFFNVPNNGKLFCLKIKSSGANTIGVKFKNFSLINGAVLYAYNEQHDLIDNPLTEYNNQQHGKYFWSLLPSDFITLVYFQPDSINNLSILLIESITYGFINPMENIKTIEPTNPQGFGCFFGNDALSCNDEVYCIPYSVPSGVQDKLVRSVFMMIGEEGQCTGTLLNQTHSNKNFLDPVFYTANHCIHEGSTGGGALMDLTSLTFFFNYSRPNCSAPPSICYHYEHPVQGAQFIADSYVLDQALLKMNAKPPPHFNVYYSGWSTSVQIPFQAQYYGIHHPKGDDKKISRANFLTVGNFATRYRVFWTNGVTEKGSSGSPFYNFNQRVIGALSGGSSGCTITGPDFYGKFRNFWLAKQSVRQTLNPVSGATIGIPGGEVYCYFSLTDLCGDYWPAGNYQPNNSIVLRSSTIITLSSPTCPGLVVKSGADFTFQAGDIVAVTPNSIFSIEPNAVVSIPPPTPCTPMRTMDGETEYEYEDEYENDNIIDSTRIINASIAPNPSNGKFTIQIPEQDELGDVNYHLEIYNPLGEKVYQSSIVNQQLTIDLSDKSKGIYFIKIISKENLFTEKIIIQ
ncbi:MAG: T9SS type A sorting domain-containing protein [Bacteroidetes bacterium]|nr:T9SS type A sorting domain-containing protein [Bacteroidota bacterium]